MKRRTRTQRALGLVSRCTAALVGAVVVTLVGTQYVRIVRENVTMANSLASVRQDVAQLRARKNAQERELRRLSDPEGAIPEIHDRLHLVRPNETIIYMKGGHSTTP